MTILSKLAEIPKFFGLSDEFDDEEMMEPVENTKDNLEEGTAASSSFFRQSRKAADTQPTANTNTSTYHAQNTRVNQPYRQQNEYTPRTPRENKVVSMENTKYAPRQKKQEMTKQSVKKIAVLEPRTYNESKNIAQCIFRSEVVIVNFHLIEEMQARRIVDFLTGVVYALDGDIQRIGDEMFLCTPPSTEIDSNVAKSILGTHFAEY